ncbi:MAG: ATP-binding cassette domain-containing protein [Geminicoccaceae bacterium]|jgi:tungstate transport system ATP-binding protein|nr:ATP-binding cassette domain-containing protein [Geminicoccaceae bacterium]
MSAVLTGPVQLRRAGEASRPAPASILPLRLQGLGFAIAGKQLLDDVDLVLEAGRRTVVLGPNGAGKSLLLRLCHGLLRPTQGRVLWSDNDADGPARRHSLLFQRPVMLRRSARANVLHGLALAGLGWHDRRERALAVLARFGLADLAERPARNLSGGEQQVLALARAAALEPEVLFLDEPTAALDPAATARIELLLQLMARDGVKLVMVTHDLGQARRFADEVVFLHRGRLIEHRPAGAFFSAPRSPEARAFVAGELIW